MRVGGEVMDDTLLTLAEVAKRLSVSIRTLEREVSDGKLTLTRVRSRRLVAPAEVDRYIAAQSCPSEKSATAGKSALDLGRIARALSERYRQGQPVTTRGNSKFRSAARRSTLQLVKSGDT